MDGFDRVDPRKLAWRNRGRFGYVAGLGRIFMSGLPEAVLDRALEAAREFATLNQRAHAATKLRTRADALAGIRAGIDGMPAEFGL